MTECRDKTRLAIKNSSHGRLKYDRHWEEEGRTRDIANDINERLCSITTSPRENDPQDKYDHSRVQYPADNYSPNGDEFLPLIHLENGHRFNSSCPDDDTSVTDNCSNRSPLDHLKHCEDSLTKFLQGFKKIKQDASSKSPLGLKNSFSLTSVTNEIANLTDCLNSDSSLVEASDINEKLDLVQQKSQQVKAQAEALDRRKSQLQQYKMKVDQCIPSTLQKLNAMSRDSEEWQNFLNDCRGKIVTQAQRIAHISKVPEPSEEDITSMKSISESIAAFCESLVESGDKLVKKIDADAVKAAELIKAEKLAAEEKKKDMKLQEDAIIAKANACKPHSACVVTTAPDDTNIKSNDEFSSTPESVFFEAQIELKKFEESIESFLQDAKQKSYRSDLTIFLKININNISTGSNDIIRSKFRILCDLFDGKSVPFRGSTINCKRHESALAFCYYTAVNTFIAAAPKQLIDVPQSAFSISAVITLLWCHHPLFGRLFLAAIYKKCPYIAGYYPERTKDDTDASYLEICGYSITGGKVESEETFLNRMRSFVKLYCAVVQSTPSMSHPRGLKYAWYFIAQSLNREPVAGTTPAILYAFLSVASYRMTMVYKRQFVKILTFIQGDFLKRIEIATTSSDKKPALEQLRLLLTEILGKINSRQFNEVKPQGIMPNNFWLSSYINSR